MIIALKSLNFIIFRFFVYLVLDKVVLPWAVKFFDQPIWHPTDEARLDKLMNAQIDM